MKFEYNFLECYVLYFKMDNVILIGLEFEDNIGDTTDFHHGFIHGS
jgi:hypothetical protein